MITQWLATIRHRQSARLTGECGQNMVEFVLVLPVVVVLVLGAIQVGIVTFQLTDVGFVAGAGAIQAARDGGWTPELAATVDTAIKNSSVAGERFAWTLETRTADGQVVCSDAKCTCDYGQQVALVADYKWEVNFVFSVSGNYHAEKLQYCWRGRMPGTGSIEPPVDDPPLPPPVDY